MSSGVVEGDTLHPAVTESTGEEMVQGIVWEVGHGDGVSSISVWVLRYCALLFFSCLDLSFLSSLLSSLRGEGTLEEVSSTTKAGCEDQLLLVFNGSVKCGVEVPDWCWGCCIDVKVILRGFDVFLSLFLS